MRIGTWNVLGLRGHAGAASHGDLDRPEGWVGILRPLDCDVLALQEAGSDPERVARIAAGLEMEAVWLPSPERWPGAILSRRPPRRESLILLRDAALDDGSFSRSGGAVWLGSGRDAGFWVVSLHAHPHDPALRAREAACLARRLREIGAPRTPAVVLGDFNCERGAPLHTVLLELGFRSAFAPDPPPRTRLQEREHVAIDHVYLSESLARGARAARVVRGDGFAPREGQPWSWSDHLPVVVDLDPPSPSEP